jgi:hypothetical protein
MFKKYLFLVPYIFHIGYVYYHTKSAELNNTSKIKPLKDLIMDNTYDLRNIEYILNPLLIIFFMPYMTPTNYIYLIDYLKIFSIIVGLRIITSTVTEIPSSNPECKPNKNGIFKYLLGHCYDKIFSGHTAATLLLILVAFDKQLITFNKYIILQILQVLYALFLISTHSHYSVDVILSYIIVIPIFILLKDKLD